jgi:hypothetical protein
MIVLISMVSHQFVNSLDRIHQKLQETIISLADCVAYVMDENK